MVAVVAVVIKMAQAATPQQVEVEQVVVPVLSFSGTPPLPALHVPRRRPVIPLTLLWSSRVQVLVRGLRPRMSQLLMFSWSVVAVAVVLG